jgi:hypothetical protein
VRVSAMSPRASTIRSDLNGVEAGRSHAHEDDCDTAAFSVATVGTARGAESAIPISPCETGSYPWSPPYLADD